MCLIIWSTPHYQQNDRQPPFSVSLSHRIGETATWAYSAYGGPTFIVSVITANLIPRFAVYHGFLSAKRHYNIQQWVHYTFNGGFPDCGLGCSSVIAHKWTAAAISPLTYHRNSSLIVFSIFHARCISEYNIAFKPSWKDEVHCRQVFCQAETMSSCFPNLHLSTVFIRESTALLGDRFFFLHFPFGALWFHRYSMTNKCTHYVRITILCFTTQTPKYFGPYWSIIRECILALNNCALPDISK